MINFAYPDLLNNYKHIMNIVITHKTKCEYTHTQINQIKLIGVRPSYNLLYSVDLNGTSTHTRYQQTNLSGI
jgi:hypothetical protein